MQPPNFLNRFLVEALKAGVKILLFYLLFQLSLESYSLLYDWKSDFQTGIFWTGYFYIFNVMVSIIGLINIILKPKHSSQLYINFYGLVILISLSSQSFTTTPYKTTLPNLIAALILLGEPIVTRIFNKVKRKKDIVTIKNVNAMPTIYLETVIDAPIKHCFDLSRSIDLHVDSLAHTKEKAIEGKTSGLIELGEWVTWKAWHFGIPLKMTVGISEMNPPYSFTDEQIKGPFRYLKHIHTFKQEDEGTIMIDEFSFQSPFWIIGRIVDKNILTEHLTKILSTRNNSIQSKAEEIHNKSYFISGYFIYETKNHISIRLNNQFGYDDLDRLFRLFQEHLNAEYVNKLKDRDYNICYIKINNLNFSLITDDYEDCHFCASDPESIKLAKELIPKISTFIEPNKRGDS